MWYKYLSYLDISSPETAAVAGDKSIIVQNRKSHLTPGVLFGFFLLFVLWVYLPAAEGQEKNAPKRPRFELAAHTVKDNLSGLMWSLNNGAGDATFSLSDAFEYLVELNSERFAGHRDWRLPTREELLSLAEHARSRGFQGQTPEKTVAAGLQTMGFRSAQPIAYWSSTGNLYNASEAWFVNFQDGSPGTGGRTLYLSIWPVRDAE